MVKNEELGAEKTEMYENRVLKIFSRPFHYVSSTMVLGLRHTIVNKPLSAFSRIWSEICGLIGGESEGINES